MNSQNRFEAEHLAQNYGRRAILTDVSFYADRGECIGIAGKNGIGKSTLFKILAGLEKPGQGQLNCFGQDLFRDKKLFRKMIGYVPQTNPLLEDLTVRDNLMLWCGHADPDEPALQTLRLTELLRRRVSHLSGGMKRRLSIACALGADPQVLLMDEPTAALDLYHRQAIYDYLKDFCERGGTVILSTHDLEEMNFCDRLYLIDQGTAEEMSSELAAEKIRGLS